MDKDLIKDIIQWDINNWSKALPFWGQSIPSDLSGTKCLELGGRLGGPSLWLALKGANVICSDLEKPGDEAFELHHKYPNKGEIIYEAIDASAIPYKEEFDIAVFKSILGGICSNGQDQLKKEVIDQIYHSLKPGGKLLFAENLRSSFLHRYMRKKFVKWGGRWNYLDYSEIENVFSSFKELETKTVGFFGAFGRSEKQRKILSVFDAAFGVFIPKSKRYIVVGVATK